MVSVTLGEQQQRELPQSKLVGAGRACAAPQGSACSKYRQVVLTQKAPADKVKNGAPQVHTMFKTEAGEGEKQPP